MMTHTNKVNPCGIRPWSYCAVVFMVLIAVTGCSDSNRGTVSGQVTLDGQPINVGSITFLPSDRSSGQGTGGRIQDGKYLLEGSAAPLIGNYMVQIRAFRKSGQMVRPAYAGPDAPMVEGSEEAVAVEYNGKTTLEIDVQPGHNEANWEVKSRKRKKGPGLGIPGF